MAELIATITETAISYVPTLISAIITLIIGLWIIGILSKIIDKQLTTRKIDITLAHFMSSLIKNILKVLLAITVLGMFGIQMTSFIAIIGAAGLAVGLALQGSLGNLAGGVLIMLFRPFKVGDFIEAQGHSGTVNKIQIFSTILKTPDNKTIIIPNGPLSNGSMTNYSTENKRRVDMVFGIGYDDDLKKAKTILQDMAKKDKRVLKDPAPQIVVGELGDSSVNFKVRLWCKSEDYWDIYFDMTENVKLEFDKQGITIPYPQRDIHLHTGLENLSLKPKK